VGAAKEALNDSERESEWMGRWVSPVGVSHQMEIPQEPGTVPYSNWVQERGTVWSGACRLLER
jgi:hypothetical protein